MQLRKTTTDAIPTGQTRETMESLKSHPVRRMSMRQVGLSLFGPVAAVLAIGLAVTYPGPSELWAGIQPVNRELRVVQAGGHNADPVKQDFTSSQLTQLAGQQPTANRDCFRDLALADQSKLDRCSHVVYQALIEVEKAARPSEQLVATNDHRRIVERLRYAATEVCRNTWVKEPVNKLALNTPACEAAQIEIASDIP